MSLATLLSSTVLPALKEYYGSQKITSLTERASPALQLMKPEYFSGKTYPTPFKTYDGAGASGDYTIAAAEVSSVFGTQAAGVTPATYFSTYQIDPLEYQASRENKGAFIQLNIAKMAAALSNMRRGLGGALYGYGYGEVGQVLEDASSGTDEIVVDSATAIKLDIGKRISIYNSSNPTSGSAISGSPYTISTITRNSSTGNYTIKLTANLSASVTAGYWVRVYGGVDGSGNGRLPAGIAQWNPYLDDRDGTDWASYIATSFFGFSRSAFVDRYCGAFYKRQSSESYADALVEGIRLARRGGLSGAAVVLVNDQDYKTILAEANAKLAYWSDVNGAKKTTIGYNFGGKALSAAFSENEVKQIIDDPFCPKGVAHIIDPEEWKMIVMTRVGDLLSNVPDANKPGNDDVYGAGDKPLNFGMLLDDWLSIEPVQTANGVGALVSINFFGNFVCNKPSANCAVVF
jgi:hypothetical protein